MDYGSTNHFERQKKSRWWSLLFGGAFLASMVLLFFGIYFLMKPSIKLHNKMRSRQIYYNSDLSKRPRYKQPADRSRPVALIISASAVITVLVFSYVRITQIKEGGGTYVPSLLKAVPLGDDHIFQSPEGQRQEKILRNVVGELSVVTGLQEPDVYVLANEDYINAMACGLDLDDSSIVLTKGCLKYLDRDELRALLAHEFSHLVNSDTRHFTLMAGWLHGLMVLKTMAFRVIVSGKTGFVVFLSLVLVVISFLANALGMLIQAAFSRSRERLADSSAAQYTRDPKALASVLKKIGGQSMPKSYSVLRHPDFRHLYAAETPSLLEK
ncbi:MAG: M48 family metalloprotease [Deltaproteobacteria bacterium]|jgi:Zn-dependent protease with chaperone function|nr:M48 family metalloprotease [Deltaproteobacteria bacterium]